MRASFLFMTRLLLVCVLLAGAMAHAAQDGPWTVVLRTATPEDAELASRLPGHLSDLPLLLRMSPGPGFPSEPGAAWPAAMELARQGPFRAVLWLRHEPAAIVVHVADPTTQRLLVRRVAAGSSAKADRSAMAEAAAIIVRSALKALVMGDAVGEVVDAPMEVPPPLKTPVAPPVQASPPGSRGWSVSVGAHALLLGTGSARQYGAQLGVGWEGTRARARGLLMASLPTSLRDEYTQVELSRYTLGGGADLALVSTPSFRLGVGLEAGLAGFLRRTRALAPGVEATAPHITPTVYGAPTVAARWRAVAVALEAGFTLDVLAVVPTLGYQQQDTFIVRNVLWRAQPRFVLSLLWGVH